MPVPTMLQRKNKDSSLETAASEGTMSGSGALRRELRGLGYDEAVQRLAPGGAEASRAIHAAASRGTAGGGGMLPQFEAIQGSFGAHDVSGVSAHVGGEATEACDAMGATAYASGNAVAFKGAPELHTAAHEAAHVVQQRAGVSLKGGVGQVGDSYERHADAVADAVVQGKSPRVSSTRWPAAANPAAQASSEKKRPYRGSTSTARRGSRCGTRSSPTISARPLTRSIIRMDPGGPRRAPSEARRPTEPFWWNGAGRSTKP
jgi:hypothetical protein